MDPPYLVKVLLKGSNIHIKTYFTFDKGLTLAGSDGVITPRYTSDSNMSQLSEDYSDSGVHYEGCRGVNLR